MTSCIVGKYSGKKVRKYGVIQKPEMGLAH